MTALPSHTWRWLLLASWLAGSLIGCGLAEPTATAASPAKQATAERPPPVVLPRTEVRTLRSEANGVGYKLYVSLPRDYREPGDPGRAYPVVYLLDADYSFALARNIVEHLSDRDHLTPAILVGVAYDGPERYRLHRTRDYTPSRVPTGGYGPEYQKHSGGAPAFHRFLTRELIPWIETEYRAAPRRVLVGHSYGGLFTTWSMLTDPEAFAGYVAVSPSLWYDDGAVFGHLKSFLESDRGLPARAYFSVGDRERNTQHDMVGDLRRLATTLEADPPPGLAFDWEVAENETHNSIFPRALSNGLRFVLEGR